MATPLLSEGWKAELSRDWDVLGPFPIQAREQQFLSPSFPLDLSQPIDYNKQYPSSYADGGRLSWSTTQATENGELQIAFPDIRWKYLRNTEGWAALQHHAVLRSSLTLYPPHKGVADATPPQLRVQLVQGSHFTIVPAGSVTDNPEWHAGNIYDMSNVLARTVQLPVAPSLTGPTTYDIFVSGDYEIRLFGDPQSHGSDVPIQSISISIDVEPVVEIAVGEPSQNVMCDFVAGYALGQAAGIGVRSVSGWWSPKAVVMDDEHMKNITISLHRQPEIAPTQTRVIPLSITQSGPISVGKLDLTLTMEEATSGEIATIPISFTLKHHASFENASETSPIIASYFFADSTPTLFATLPPRVRTNGKPHPPILFLHGAGVDVLGSDFWDLSPLPQQERSWIVVPTGRTTWGLDWHGPSTQDVWDSLDALIEIILNKNDLWRPWAPRIQTPVIVIGHSNGGQGAWYIASRFPDRVLAVVPAAAYIKSQAYVPLTMSRSSHFMDPALRAVLESAALTPDDNDLFLSNLVDTPIFAIHGGEDENVPVWHTREAVSALLAWNSDANVSFYEAAGMGHWYDTIINNARVQDFLDGVFSSHTSADRMRETKFTLTVSIPAESGSLHGFKIEAVKVPGRLARLHVGYKDHGTASVQTENVRSFSVNAKLGTIHIDGDVVLPSDATLVWFSRKSTEHCWTEVRKSLHTQSAGRVQEILKTAAPISLVIPTKAQNGELSVALRIAHDLFAFHNIDSAISRSDTVFSSPGAIVLIATSAAPAVNRIISQNKTAFQLNSTTGGLRIHHNIIDTADTGILFLHPHPTGEDSANLLLFVLGTDEQGLNRAARLFPIRTGIAVPDWIIVGSQASSVGAAGVVGAGVWNRWRLEDSTSWQ